MSVGKRKTVVVLNASMEPVHFVNPQKAITMIVRGVALMEESDPKRKFGPFEFPVKLRLVKYVSMSWAYATPISWSKVGVMRRDHYRCAYCDGHADTIDHLHPVSKGGKSTWENTIASCGKCNRRKSDKLLENTDMVLLRKPFVPQRHQLISYRLEKK